MREVTRAQDSVAAGGQDHYLTAYRSSEVAYWSEIAAWLHELAPGCQGARCLDIGCAYGTLAVYVDGLFGGETFCTDMRSDALAEQVIARHGLSFAANNFELEPLPWREQFDVIVFTEVLEHLNFNPVPSLRRLRDLLRPDGRIYLSTPDASRWGRVTSYYQSLDEMPSPEVGRERIGSGEWEYVDAHIWQYTKEELHRLVGEAGLVITREGMAPGVIHRHFNLELMAD